MRIFAVFDVKTAVYGLPFFAPTIAAAVRSLGDAVKSPDKTSDVARHPEDFRLYDLGEYDEVSGEVSAKKPAFIIDCSALTE
jgi:hypothetical protein